MRKIVGLLVALALVLSLSATIFAAPVAVNSKSNVSVSADGLTFSYKARTAGVLSITISGDPGYRVTVTSVKTGDVIGMPEVGDAEQTFTFSLEAATSYNIQICGFDKATWDVAAATVSFTVTFDDAPPVVNEPVEIDISDVPLELGENNVTLLENTIVSLFTFSPAEPGIYTFTADGAEFGSYGFAWNLIQSSENGVLEYTATAAEQTILIGLSADTATVNVKVEKTGDYTPPVQIQYEEYIPVDNALPNFEEPEGMESIDITQEQNVVLGDDGYYHLGTASGPIVYVNLNTNQFTLAILYGAGAPIHMRGIYIDENGDPHYYDFMNMITRQYYDFSQENDYHPLNTDLMIFLKGYGTSQGWYNVGTSAFESIQSGNFVEESAWLAGCYSSPNAPVITDPNPAPSNPTEPSAPTTEPSAPTTEPSAPATEPSAPATEPSAPATEPSAPATEPSAPATEPSTPAGEPSAPATEPSAPATEPSAPATEPSAPTTEPDEDDMGGNGGNAGNDGGNSGNDGGNTDNNGGNNGNNGGNNGNNGGNNGNNGGNNGNDGGNTDNDGGNTDNNGGNTDNDGGNTDNNGGNTDNNGGNDNADDVPQTGGIGIMGAVVAIAFSAMGGVAIVAKKKEF